MTENFKRVGDVIIEDMVASGFSTSNYIQLPAIFNPNGSNWEMFFKINSGSLTAPKGIFTVDRRHSLSLGMGTKLSVWISSNGSSWLESTMDNNGITTLKENTDYYLKATYINNVLNVYLSEDGNAWTTEFTQNISLAPVTSNCSKLGVYRSGSGPFSTGSIDLSVSYIKVNNEMYWQPYEATNEYSLNVPDLSHGYKYSSQALEGLTYTNNILKNTTSSSAGKIDTGVILNVSADDSWEWCIRFKQTARSSSTSYMLNYGYYKTGPWVAIGSANTLILNIWDGSSYRGGGSSGEIELNTWYTTCVGSNGETLFMRYKKDGGEWIECSTDGTPLALNITEGIRIGKPSHDVLFVGEWDFAQSYIKINGKMLWPNDVQKYQGICTKDFMPQAGTNTFNAYHIEYTDGTSECLLGQTEPTGEDIKSVQLLKSGLTFEEDKAWTYNEDSEQFE